MVIICHEKECNTQATFNKDKKTSREHKKEDMISIMYKYNNNHVDQVFKMLPLVLQWEILVELVGGYVVCNNRLRRLMSGDLQKKIMKHNFKLIIDKYVVRCPLKQGLWINLL